MPFFVQSNRSSEEVTRAYTDSWAEAKVGKSLLQKTVLHHISAMQEDLLVSEAAWGRQGRKLKERDNIKG